MISLVLSLCLAALDLRVEGLSAGERATILPAAAPATPDSDLERHAEGRVIDATTGRPVAGAWVECWTEEISEMGRGFRQVGEGVSASDGCFRVRTRDGGLEGDRFRVRKEGYLTLPASGPRLEPLRLMPAPDWTPRLVVLDLEDRPVAGARVTSTFSCAHDRPAFERSTDALGRVDLSEYGLQASTGELRVRAPGRRAIQYLDAHDVLRGPGDATVLRLARRAGIRARILGEDGLPLAGAALHVVDGEGYHVPFTGLDGRFEITSCYDGAEPRIEVLREGGNVHVSSGRLPSARTMSLRVRGHRPPADLPRGTLRVELREEGVPLELYHDDGWRATPRGAGRPTEVEFVAGRAWLLVGGPFSGFEEELIELSIPAGGTARVEPSARREPTLTVLTPPGEAHAIVVEAGDDSRSARPDDEGRVRMAVPGGRAITVLSEGEGTRHLSLPPLAEDATADLRSDSCVLEPASRAVPRGTLEVRLESSDGAPCPGELTARGPGEPEVRRNGSASFTLEADVGSPLVLCASAEGHAQSFGHARVSANSGAARVLRPARLAALALDLPEGAVVEGPEAERLDALHPGPLLLEVVLRDGRRIILELALEPGAERHLRIVERGR